MSIHRPDISNASKKRLRAEVGHKCANPGCANQRTHIHHIREWAVYQTHDEQHMIAVCPSCHDAIHHGNIPMHDVLLYQWKSTRRESSEIRSHVYVEPGDQSKVLLGSIAVTTPKTAVIFELSTFNRLKFSIKDGDVLLLDLSISTLAGVEMLRVVDNYVRHSQSRDVEFRQVPGTVEVLVPTSEDYVPAWALQHMQLQEPSFGAGGKVAGLRLSVLKPGLVRVQGVWAQPERAAIVTEERLSFLRPDLKQPISLVGAGEDSVLHYTASGVIDVPMFGFDTRSALNVGRKR